MKKSAWTICLAALILGFFAISGFCAEPYEEAFKKAYPNVPYDSIKPSPIKGMYEVSKGVDIIYFFEDPGLLFVGEILDNTGKSLTDERKMQMIVQNVKKVPLDKALKIGDGKNTVIEFTDPDCPYCRRAASFFEGRKDVTQYIFFFPLPSNKDAENKIKYIFCSADRAKAYHDAMKGKLDTQKYTVCKKPEAAELLNLHKEVGSKIGVGGTPMFIINGKELIVGANFPAIEAALGTGTPKVPGAPKPGQPEKK
jgi:thiol:disulfide interchange protein DsbC